jgi:pimeloyl-ACP methyl ester carboxylesterase
VPTADLNGRKLGYIRRGSGEPLLLVPGMAMHNLVWNEEFLGRLESDFDIIALNHRNIADSDDVPGEFTVRDLADDAVALLDVLGVESVHLFGFSLGGMVAQEIVLNHPDRVRTLVLAATYPGGEGTDLNAPGPLTMLTAGQSGDVDTALRASFVANLSRAYTADESRYLPFKEAGLAQRVRVETVIAQARAAFVHDARERLAGITVPTLVLHGTEDQMILYANGTLLASLIPGADMHTFEETGHLFFWEHPHEAAELVRKHALAR